jgi:DNA-binding MarR family transcriptional regulator
MKLFHHDTELVGDGLADSVMEVSIRVMRRVRGVLRGGSEGLSFTQVRSLGCLHQSPGVSLSDVSDHLGLQAPTTSKTIEELVQAGLVRRDVAPDDRRRVTLHLTRDGARTLERSIAPARKALAEVISPLNPEEREVVRQAMSLLLPLLDPGAAPEMEAVGE